MFGIPRRVELVLALPRLGSAKVRGCEEVLTDLGELEPLKGVRIAALCIGLPAGGMWPLEERACKSDAKAVHAEVWPSQDRKYSPRRSRIYLDPLRTSLVVWESYVRKPSLPA